MELPRCYDDRQAVKPFLEKARSCLPFLAYEPIQRAFIEQDNMFKCVAIAHIKNYFKKAHVSESDFKELIRLLDAFQDPYQEFIEKNANRTWTEIKNNLLGGLL